METKLISWHLYPDGGGTLTVFTTRSDGSGVDQAPPKPFESLDELPERYAAAIRESGQESGETIL